MLGVARGSLHEVAAAGTCIVRVLGFRVRVRAGVWGWVGVELRKG